MIVHLLALCPHCQGQAYLPAGESHDSQGRTSNRIYSCPMCIGEGNGPAWVSLPEVAIRNQKSPLRGSSVGAEDVKPPPSSMCAIFCASQQSPLMFGQHPFTGHCEPRRGVAIPRIIAEIASLSLAMTALQYLSELSSELESES